MDLLVRLVLLGVSGLGPLVIYYLHVE
jgi:hypothetical protein